MSRTFLEDPIAMVQHVKKIRPYEEDRLKWSMVLTLGILFLLSAITSLGTIYGPISPFTGIAGLSLIVCASLKVVNAQRCITYIEREE